MKVDFGMSKNESFSITENMPQYNLGLLVTKKRSKMPWLVTKTGLNPKNTSSSDWTLRWFSYPFSLGLPLGVSTQGSVGA